MERGWILFIVYFSISMALPFIGSYVFHTILGMIVAFPFFFLSLRQFFNTLYDRYIPRVVEFSKKGNRRLEPKDLVKPLGVTEGQAERILKQAEKKGFFRKEVYGVRKERTIYVLQLQSIESKEKEGERK